MTGPIPDNGIISALAVMVAGITQNAKGFRIDRIELNPDAMRAFERGMADALGAEEIRFAAEAPRKFGKVPLQESSVERPLIAIVLDMAYTLEPDRQHEMFR